MSWAYPFDRNLSMLVIAGIGVIVAWLVRDPWGLLVAVVAGSLIGGRRASLMSTAAFALALIGFLVVGGWNAYADHVSSHQLGLLLAVGLATSGLIHLEQATRSSGHDEHEARLIVESMPGHGWSSDREGKYIYVSPSTLKYVGQPVEALDRIEGTDEFGWRQVVHPDDYDRVVESWLHSLRSGEPYANEHRIRRHDGTYRWFRNAGMPSRDRTGRITGWYGTTIDIHDQKTAELALRESRRQLQQMIDAVPALIFSTSPEGAPTYVNERFSDVTGANLADITAANGSPSLSVVHPDDRGAAIEAFKQSLATGSPYRMQYRQIRRGGAYRWTETHAEPLRDENGQILQWYGVCVDIDDLVRAQEALRERERYLQLMVDTIPAFIWCLTPEGAPSYFNKRVIDHIGLSVAELTTPQGRLDLSSIHVDDRLAVHQALERSLATGQPFIEKYRQRRGKTGGHRWTDGRAEALRDADGKIVQWYGVYSDIHDEVMAQESLRERERELSHLVNMVPSYLWRLTPEGEPNFYNKRLVDFFGVATANADKPGLSRLAAIIDTAVHPDDAEGVSAALRHSFSTGEPFSRKYRLRRSDGVYRWVEGRAEPLRDEEGRIVQWYGLAHDIDDHVRADEALRESERTLRQLVETLPAMIDCAAPDGEPIYRSRQLREYLGYSLEDLDKNSGSRLIGTLEAGVHPDDLEGVKASYAFALSTGEPYARKHRLRRFDGAYRWVETRAASMRSGDGAIVQWNVICLDIEDQVRAQEELRQAQERLARASQEASLAELSASIAHEVNQPLAAVVANSHACQRWLNSEPPNLDRAQITVERIIRDANSAADVVSRIRALFRQSVELRSVTTIAKVIAEARELMTEDALRRRVQIDVDVERNLPPVAFDRVQIQQVIINLMRNGIDAMDAIAGHKTLGIKTHRIGDSIHIEISDCGQGVEFPDKIFEPFFTTKEHGMGMGLAICRSIVESHGGRLWVENNEPRGARFIFTLPIELRAAT